LKLGAKIILIARFIFDTFDRKNYLVLAKLQEQYQLSYWEREVFFRDLDLVIVGSGIVGLSAAIHACERYPGARVAVLERGPLPIGASTRNAGFACFGSMTELISDIERMGESAVWALVERRWRGLCRLRERIVDEALDYQACGGYELFRPDDEEESLAACLERIDAYNRALKEITGEPRVFSRADDQIAHFGFGQASSLIRNGAEGRLHPGKLVLALARQAQAAGAFVFTGLPVHAFEDGADGVRLEVGPGWTIRAGRVLVATNAFARQLLPDEPVQPARNQVLVTQPLSRVPFNGCFHYDRGFYYFRDIDGRILLGGGRNLAEEQEQTMEFGPNPLIRAALLRLLRTIVAPWDKNIEIDTWWTGVLGIGEVKAPIIRKVSPHVAAAVRLGGMGVAIGTLVGEEGARVAME
jgi:gamma-glutamylputrescine oxidase